MTATTWTVFPAHAGMSRSSRMFVAWSLRFPRPRGDEPNGPRKAATPREFSPPTRG